jgi:hypothetical protein
LEAGKSGLATILGGVTAARKSLAHVYGIGAIKYGDNNWKRGYPWSWSYQAVLRHLAAVEEGQYIDPESGEPHYTHVWWHLHLLIYFDVNGLGTDDREVWNGRKTA